MARDRTFQEVVAETYGRAEGMARTALNITLRQLGPQSCPSPSWDPHGTYRVALAGDTPRIERLNADNEWIEAEVQPPKAMAVSAKSEASNMEFKSKTRSILFMDIAGWSRLDAHQIHSYVTKVMPKVAAEIKNYDMLNTWGDAIVATFESAKDAAESALHIKDVFERTYQHQGMPPDLKCRIALHHGEIILSYNALRKQEDIFGHAVHMAARLEPLTAPGHVFCTDLFAGMLGGIAGSGPKAWPVGKLTLPKKFGSVDACVVTWHAQSDPRPGLKEFLDPAEGGAAPPAASTATHPAVSEKTARVRIDGWISKLPNTRYNEAILFSEVDTTCGLSPGTAVRLLPDVIVTGGGNLKLKANSETDFILQLDMPAPGAFGRGSGWDGPL